MSVFSAIPLLANTERMKELMNFDKNTPPRLIRFTVKDLTDIVTGDLSLTKEERKKCENSLRRVVRESKLTPYQLFLKAKARTIDLN